MAQILGADLSFPNILNTSTSLKSSKGVHIKFIFPRRIHSSRNTDSAVFELLFARYICLLEKTIETYNYSASNKFSPQYNYSPNLIKF